MNRSLTRGIRWGEIIGKMIASEKAEPSKRTQHMSMFKTSQLQYEYGLEARNYR